MPHSPEDKRRALTRLKRIKGQAEALERAIAAGTACGVLLQQIAVLRGAAGGLMAEVLESHLRETFGPRRHPPPMDAADGTPSAEAGLDESRFDEPTFDEQTFDETMRILRTYLK